MRVSYTTADGRMTFQWDAQGVKGAFASLAQVQGVFILGVSKDSVTVFQGIQKR